jgi:hypothetical protein
MKEQRIHRNITHVPKVWGVTYSKLFLTLGGGLLITALGFSMASGAGTIVKIGIICLGGLITVALHGICWWYENQAGIIRDAPFLKKSANSQSVSLQINKFHKTESETN